MNSPLNETPSPVIRLRDRALKAGVWTLGAYGFDLSARLISNLVMARLLFPEAFGTLAAASALIAALGMMSDFGVRAIIIQNSQGDQEEFLRSAWVFQLWRGVAVWVILVSVCALISVPDIHR